MSYNMGIPIDFDKKEFYEFIWHVERLAEQRKKDNDEAKKNQGVESLESRVGGMFGG